ncbi:MAG: PDZ domain-containing protein [Fimbriimonadaceae bacterium]|nr:PDZ domain-containing protein [Fimbriimonadaceae bacterium]
MSTSVAFLTLALLASPQADDFGKVWDDCARSIRRRYFARESRKDRMESLLGKYGPRAKTAKSRREFADAVNAMIVEFGDSHFALLTPEDQGYALMDNLAGGSATIPHVGAWFRKGGDGYTVQMVLDGTPAMEAGLRPGDLILTVNGKPFTPVSSLAGLEGESVELSYRRGGETRRAKTRVETQTPLDMFLDATRESARVIERDGKRFGYVHLWTMANDRFRTALHGLIAGKLADTDGFVLDLRDGFGGRPEGFADPFFRPDVQLEWKFAEGAPGMKQSFGYGKPLVTIINGGSRSAKEVLAFVLKRSKRATLLGATTAGHVLGTTPYRIADWAFLEIPMVDVIADGVRLEGKGVAPDIVLPIEFGPDGSDLYLERSLALLASGAR